MTLRTRLGGVGLLLLGAAYVLWLVWVRPDFVAGRQVSNWADMSIYVHFLDEYRQSHGRYPDTLEDAVPHGHARRDRGLASRDTYDHELHYESDGHRFLLASFGHDGTRDVAEYRQAPGKGAVEFDPCLDWNVDTVYSSDGIRHLCGK